MNFQLHGNYFNENIWHKNYSFHMQEHRWTTSRGYAAESARDVLQRDAFEVDIALLTAVSLSRQQYDSTCVLDRTRLYATPILHYMCGVRRFRQQTNKIISTKSSNTAIHKNLDPTKFSAVWYTFN